MPTSKKVAARAVAAMALAVLGVVLGVLLLAPVSSPALAQQAGAGDDLPISLQPAMGATEPATPPAQQAPAGDAAPVAPSARQALQEPVAPPTAEPTTPAEPAAPPAASAPVQAPNQAKAARAHARPAATEPAADAAATPPAIVDVLPHFLQAGVLVGVVAALMLMVALFGSGAFGGQRGGALLFGAGVLLFVLAYTGALSVVPGLRLDTGTLTRLAALAEALMLFGAGWWLTGWLGMPASQAGRLGLMVAAGLGISLVALAPFFAASLLPIIRVAMLMLAVGGLAALLRPDAPATRSEGLAGHLALGGLVLWAVLGVLLAFKLFTITSAQAVLMTAAGVSLLAVMVLTAAMRAEAQAPADAALARALAGAEALPLRYEPHSQRLALPSALAQALHLPPEVVENMEGFLTIVHPQDRPLLLAALRAASLDEPVEMTLRLADGEGVWRHFQLRARALDEGRGAARPVSGLLLAGAPVAGNTSLPANAQAEGDDENMPGLRDPLTGLPGQALLLDRLESALARARRGKGLPCMVIVDVDRFRTILDTLGIAAGDLLLIGLARRMQALLHEEETLARLQGDQFALIIDAERHGTPLAFIQRLRAALAEPLDLDGRETVATVSIGVVDLVAAMTLSPREVIRAAELALFEARRDGPGREAFYTPDMHGEHTRLAKLEQELRRALKMGELEVHYQPVVWLNGRLLAGFEALLRWRHPQRGLIGPEEFLGLAEEIGLMREIGQLVLHESVRQLGIWQRAFRTEYPFYIAVNIATTDLLDMSLAEEVADLLARENADPAGLKLEVTEHMLLRDPARARATLQQLAEIGVGVFCDDFGTGHSSLSRLKSLPFDALKIDRGFLADDSPASRGIIGAVVELAHGLSMRVVAEGVEEPWQLRMLEQIGCDMAQGFLLAQPLDATTILQTMTEARRIAPFSGRLAALSHLLLNEEVAPDPLLHFPHTRETAAPRATTREGATDNHKSASNSGKAGDARQGKGRSEASKMKNGGDDDAGGNDDGKDEHDKRTPRAAE